MSRRIIDYRLEQVLAIPRRDGLDHGRIESFADLAVDGWQPWGAPVFYSGDPFQALVKYADEPEDGSDAAMVQRAINAERDAVVAYVREWGKGRGRHAMSSLASRNLADQIEADEHHRSGT